MKKSASKGFQLYVLYVVNEMSKNKQYLYDFAILREFKDVFPNEVPDLTPKRGIYFTIDLVLGEFRYQMHLIG